MTKFTADAAFVRRFKKLSNQDKDSFNQRALELGEDLDAGIPPRSSLGVRIFRKYASQRVHEFKWAADGRALFRYGIDDDDGQKHVIWLIVGTHSIYETWEP